MLRLKVLFVVGLALLVAGFPGPVWAQSETPVPTPQRPLIFVRSSWVEPEQVAPGGLCRLYLELHNVGDASATKILVSLSGQNFVPELSSSVKTVNSMQPNEHATVWQEFRVSPGIEGGVYPVTVQLNYDDENGYNYPSTEVVGIKVLAATPTPKPAAAGRPQIVIESFTAEPKVPVPGQPLTLTLTLHNTGTGAARNVLLTNGAPSVFAAAGTGNVIAVSSIGWQQSVQVEVPLIVDQTAQAGLNTHPITLDYDSTSGEHTTSAQNVGIEVGAGETGGGTPEPLVVVQTYKVEPETLTPGQPFTLTLSVVNVGPVAARRVTLTLGGQTDFSKSAPIAPLGSGNVRYLPAVEAGAAADVVTQFIVDGAASAGVYVLAVGFEYSGGGEKPLTRDEQVTLVVKVRPQLLFNFYRPVPPAVVGGMIDLPIEILNIGRGRVASSDVEVVSEDVQVETPRSFIGALDAGSSVTLDATAVAGTPGEKRLRIRVYYIDDFNQPQVFEGEKMVQVQDAPAGQVGPDGAGGPMEPTPPASPSRPWLLRLLLGLLGLGSG